MAQLFPLWASCLNSVVERNTTRATTTENVRLVYQTCAYVGLFHD